MHGLRSGVRWVLWLGVAWLVPSLASAVPVTYTADGGSVVITATAGATNLLTTTPIPLDPGNFVTFDEDVPEISDLLLSITSTGFFPLSAPYAGYTNVAVDMASVVPAAGYDGSGLNLVLPGPTFDNYSYSVGPLNIFGTWSAFNASGPPPPALVGNAFPPIIGGNLVGTLFVNTVTGNLALFGVTLGTIPAPVNSGLPPLVIKGDFFFRGAVPEPATFALLGMGLLGLLAVSRRIGS